VFTGLGSRRWTGWVAALVVLAGVGLTAAPAQAATAAATATITGGRAYVGNSVGLTYALTVKNTGTRGLAAVRVTPPPGWSVLGCLAAPAGWSRVARSGACAFTSPAGASGDIAPRGSAVFKVRTRTARSAHDLTGAWRVSTSTSTSTQTVAATGPLTLTAYSVELRHVIARGPAPRAGTACPAAANALHAGSTGVLVVCATNHSTATLSAAASRSHLGGSFASPGAFTGGPVHYGAENVVVGSWSGVRVTARAGNRQTIATSVGSVAGQTSPTTPFAYFDATNARPAAAATSVGLDEDSSMLVTLRATDADGDPLSFGVGTPPTKGTLSVIGAPTCSGSPRVCTATVTYTPTANSAGLDSFGYTVRDGFGGAASATASLTVRAVNDAPTDLSLSPSSVPENQPADTVVGGLSTTDADTGDLFSYALVAGTGATDNGVFHLDGSTLLTSERLDHEAHPTYAVRIRATDSGGLVVEKALTVTATNVNEPPISIALNDASVAENQPVGTVVGQLSATDTDTPDTDTFSLPAGQADNSQFAISGTNLRAAAVFDREAKASYTVLVRATDLGGLTVDQLLTVTIVDKNEAPTALSLTGTSLVENAPPGTTVGGLSGTDPEGDPLTFALVPGALDNASFTVSGTTLTSAVAFDAETRSTYTVKVRVSDGQGNTLDRSFVITVLDTNDAPSGLALSHASVPENSPAGNPIGTLTATDQDPGETFTFTLPSGLTDNGAFGVTGSSLVTSAPLDLESKASYSVTVRVTDHLGATYDRVFQITLENVNEAPTNVALDNSAVPENSALGTVVGGLSTTDPDAGDTFSYALPVGLGDNGQFKLSGANLLTAAPLNRETKASYAVVVRTKDAAGLTLDKALTVTVGNVDETPTDLDLTPASVGENQAAGATVGTLSTTDPDAGDTFTYTLVGGPDLASFRVAGSTLTTAATFDRETKASYSVKVRSTDSGALFVEKTLTIAVIDLNDAPTGVALSPSAVAENAGVTTVGTLSSTDQDVGDAHAYSLVNLGTHPDNASFSITGSTLSTTGSFNAEAKASYTIDVQTQDASGGTYHQELTVTVVDLNEAPTSLDLDHSSVAENAAVGAVVGGLSAVDPDAGDTRTFSLPAGVGNNSQFTVAGTNLVTSAVFDREAKASYSVTIRVTDSKGLRFDRAVTVTVDNVNEVPTSVALDNAAVPENRSPGTKVGGLTTTDPDAADSFVYSLDAGGDNDLFAINGGDLVTGVILDREVRSSYLVTVRTTDTGGLSSTKAFTVTVTNVNEAPTDLSLSKQSVLENAVVGTKVGSLSTTDPDVGDTRSYTLSPGVGDNDAFRISGTDLVTAAVFDKEARATYTVTVTTRDAGGLTLDKTFTLSITDVNEAPSDIALANSLVLENAAVPTVIGGLSTTDQDAGDTFTYSLPAGLGDNASFSISGSKLTTAVSFDKETKASYTVVLRSRDAGGLTVDRLFTVSVVDVNEAPTALVLSPSTVAENLSAGSTVGALSTTDPDVGSTTFSYAFAGGVDDAKFAISGATVTLVNGFDYEAASSYTIRMRTTDSGGLSFVKDLTVMVSNVNEAPTAIALTPSTTAENRAAGATIGTLSTTDVDAGDTFGYTLTGGADAGSFTISGATLHAASGFDFEAKASYAITVTSTDAGGLSVTKNLVVTVTNVNEAPTAIAVSPSSVPENSPAVTTVGTLLTTDPDTGDTFSYALAGGADDASFTITGSTLNTAASFDFEAKAAYTVAVTSTDAGGLSVTQELTISVTNVNEAPTVLTLTPATVPENQPIGTTVGTLATLDADAGDTFSYSFAGGADDGSFTISGATLQTAASFDVETASSYSVKVRSTDAGGSSVVQDLTVTVTNVNEAPNALALSPATIAENLLAGATVGTLTANDVDAGDTLSYALAGGTDDAAFTISGATLKALAALDFEVQPSYAIKVTVTDAGGLSLTKDLTVTVTNVNDAPTALALSNSSVVENAPDLTIGTLSTTDQDTADTAFSYTLVNGATHPDNALLSISGATLSLRATADFESQSSYLVDVQTSDGHGGTFDRELTVTVTDANDAPTALALSNRTIDENATDLTVGTLSTTDQDAGDTPTYTFISGTHDADNAAFTLSGATLSSKVAADFESKASYVLEVQTSDGRGGTLPRTFTITVNDVNEAPTAVTLTGSSVDERSAAGTLIGTLSSADPDAGSTFGYSFVAGTGSTDNASFQLNGSRLESRTSLTAGTYTVRISSTDGTLAVAAAFSISVLNVNDAPTAVQLSPSSVAENQPAGTTVGTLTTSDPDAGDTFSYALAAGVADNARFAVSGSTVTTVGTIDYETDPSLTVQVTSTDAGGLSVTTTLTLTVTNVYEAPSSITLTPATVAENQPPGTIVGTLAVPSPDANDGSITYAFAGGADDASFTISGSTLTSAASFDAEAQASYQISVTATGSSGSVTKPLTVTVSNVNEAPTGLHLSGSSVETQSPAGTPIGTLTSDDPDAGSTFSYAFATGSGDSDNAAFQLSGAQLQSKDLLTAGTYTVRLATSDGALSYSQAFSITVTPVANTAPTAVADSLTGSLRAVGNTPLVVNTGANDATVPAGAHKTVSASILSNDTDPESNPLTAVANPAIVTGNGGTVDLKASGSFTYTPPAGCTPTSDTFSYTVTDGSLTSTTMVTVNLLGCVWYVDQARPSDGTGTAGSPFLSLAHFQASRVDRAGDTLSLAPGGYTGGLPLLAGEAVLGTTSPLVVPDGGVGSTTLLAAAGSTNPSLAGGLVLATNNNVQGLDLGNAALAALRGTSFGTATIGNVTAGAITNSTGPALSLTTGTATAAFSTLTGQGLSVSSVNGTLSGASGAIAAPGVAISGGTGTVTLGSSITGGSGSPALSVSGSTGGTKTFSGAVTAASGAGVSLTGNTGATVLLSGALTLSTGAQGAFTATGGGTVSATSAANVLTTTTGTAVTISGTTIGASDVTFRSVTTNGASRSIALSSTGTSGRLVVTGTGGSCTLATPAGCTGGTLANGVGGDDPGLNPVGTGIVLYATKAPSLSNLLLQDFTNYAIRGQSTEGLVLANSVITGVLGSSASDNAAVSLIGLTGATSITGSTIQGGYVDDLVVSDSAGRVTLDTDTFGLTGTTTGDDAVFLESVAGNPLRATVTGSTFTGTRGDLFQYKHVGSGVGDLVLVGNHFSDTGVTAVAGGGGVTLGIGGSAGPTTMTVTGNDLKDADGAAVLITKDLGPSSLTGSFNGNTIGVNGVASSGSKSGDGLKLQSVGGGTLRWTVNNNQIRGYNNFGIDVVGGGGGTPTGGTVATTITNNTIAQPSSGTFVQNGVQLNLGTAPGDSFVGCADLRANTTVGSGANGGADLRLRQRQSTSIQLPGYTGGATDTAAVIAFLQGQNAGPPSVAASTQSPGSGFTNAASC
jgi:hypothetical protein